MSVGWIGFVFSDHEKRTTLACLDENAFAQIYRSTI